MLESMTWLLKYSILLVNSFILYLLYKRNAKSKKANREKNALKNVLLVTAHPDDETMFFSPLLNYLQSENFNTHVLCLTYGQLLPEMSSPVRKSEFESVMDFLKIKDFKILNLENEGVFDSPKEHSWDLKIVHREVANYVTEKKIDCVFTFDYYGISGHQHHSWVSETIQINKNYFHEKSIKVYLLRSVGIFRKFCLIWDALCLFVVEFVNVLTLSLLGKEIWPQFIFLNFKWMYIFY